MIGVDSSSTTGAATVGTGLAVAALETVADRVLPRPSDLLGNGGGDDIPGLLDVADGLAG